MSVSSPPGAASFAPLRSDTLDVRSDRGSAIAEFVLVGALLSLVFASLLQLGLAMHVKNTVVDSAVAGARQAGLGDQSAADGEELTRTLVSSALSPSYADDISVSRTHENGLDIVTVTVTTPVPVLGLLGPRAAWELTGRSIAEDLG